MKNVNSIVLGVCLVFGAGSVVAQDNGKVPDSMGHDQTIPTAKAHDGMKKGAMGHDAMKMHTMSKDHMAKDGMSKDAKDDMMKKDDAMGNGGSQH
jgi:pentapeptide MXKDX repeat protein